MHPLVTGLISGIRVIKRSLWWYIMVLSLRISVKGFKKQNLRIFPGIFHWKIQWKCRQQFRGISCNPFREISHDPFQGISHNQVRGISCNPFWRISHNTIQGISCNQFQGISCYQFCRKTRENVSWEFPAKSSSESIPGNFLGTIPKIFSRVLQENLIKFTNQDIGLIIVVVNVL